MNYRHAFHVGNHADVLKHAALIFCLDHLAQKPAPFAALDTHAGAGLYDLTSEPARRSPEWESAVGRLWRRADAPPLIASYLAALKAHNEAGALRFYPGSPLLIAARLREQDRLIACELHAEEHALLKASLRQGAAQLHRRDAYEALAALTPFPERRGLILVDPPYEAPDEIATAARAILSAARRFPTATYLWWRPLKDEQALARADAELALLNRPLLRLDLAVAAPQAAGKLAASSLLLVNPPFTLAPAFKAAGPWLVEALAAGAGAFWRVL